MLFKTTQEILTNTWDCQVRETTVHLPPKILWNQNSELTMEDVELWEQIYYQPGNVGIYAAWTPYAELYIVVYDLFMVQKQSIEIFKGSGASDNVFKKASKLGIDLSAHRIWVSEEELNSAHFQQE
jgi:hypothetical protein